jgi:hypothetical protein
MASKIKLALIGFGLLAVLGLAYIYFNLNHLAQEAIEQYGAKALKTKVTVGRVSLSPFTGNGSIQNLRVANPSGFSNNDAIVIGTFHVTLDISTMMKPVIQIQNITMEDSIIRVEFKKVLLENNIQTLLNHVNQNKKSMSSEDPPGAQGSRLVINQLLFTRGAIVTSSTAPGEINIPIHNILLKKIGENSNGATIAEILPQILTPILESILQNSNVILKNIEHFIPEGAQSEINTLGNTTHKTTDQITEGAKKLLSW